MCGIIINCGGDYTLTKKMINTMGHRGTVEPSVKTYFNKKISVGHVRLPIQGLSPSFNQPYSYKDLDGFLVGEIFNFKSFCFSSTSIKPELSDLPVLVKSFHSYEETCFDLFDGFWSVGIIDKFNKILHVFTDDLAKKPLYYRRCGEAIFIASEIKALNIPELPKTSFDEVYFSSIRKWGYCIENRTPYNEIKKLPPTTHLIFSKKGQLKKIKKLKGIGKANYQELRSYIELAVKNRLVSDIPISLLLSGGLDSTIIFELTKKYTTNFTVYHIDNNEEDFLNYLNFPSNVKVKKISLNNNYPIREILEANETPVDLGSMVPQYKLGREIKKDGINVTLTGDGADELFGGYKRASEYDSQYSDIFHELVFYHLPRLDKLMMASTIELRSPFLSRNVISRALSIPYKKRKRKEYLKSIFSDIVPEQIIKRGKKPLKIENSIRDKMGWRKFLIREFKKMKGKTNEY